MRTYTLDGLRHALNLPRIDVIKIDVQGYEQHVQAGMSGIMKSADEQIVLTEFWPAGIRRAGGSPEMLFSTFLNYGFSAHLLTASGHLAPITLSSTMERTTTCLASSDDGRYVNLAFVKGRRFDTYAEPLRDAEGRMRL